jgi:pyridoxine 5-phosphate synthase
MRLGVNVDHIATLRQARRGRLPDPVEAALACERAGADSIVCHLREDRRHIQDEDVRRLRAAVTSRLNLEMSIAEEIVRVALALKPHQVTLVPERRRELTTEGGLDAVKLSKRLQAVVGRFRNAGIAVSLFVDPVPTQVKAAKRTGAATIELHTGGYATAATPSARARELAALHRAAEQGRALGLAVAAGHGLDYDNVGTILEIPEIEELNIGYAIIVRALSVGLKRAVAEMADLVHQGVTHATPTLQAT